LRLKIMPGKGLHGRGAVRAFGAVAGVVAAAVLSSATAFAAPGELDPTFSSDGKQTVNFGSDETRRPYADMALTPSGKIVLLGTTEAVVSPADAEQSFGLAQLLPDGTLDPSFGGGDGLVVKDLGYSAEAGAVAVQPDGKIVVVGHDSPNPSGSPMFFDVLRFNADGTPDSTFGSGGVKSVPFTGPLQVATGVAIAPDGRIVVCGYVGGTDADQLVNTAVAVLNSNGSPNTTFSGDGMLTTTTNGDDGAFDVAIQPDGKIVVAGLRNGAMVARRYRPDGIPDPLFGQSGFAEADFPSGASTAAAVALQSDGSIILAGTAGDPDGDLAVARLSSNGALDSAFSGDGEFTLDLGSTYDEAASVAIQADGKIIVGGEGGSDQRNLVALRLNRDGSPDAGFAGGLASVSFASTSQAGGHVAIQADGGILLSGVTDNNDDFAVARLQGDSPPVTLPPPNDGDTDPPETTITKFPKDHLHKSKAKYRFESTEPHSTFECALDSKNFVPCGNGKVKYKHLDPGKYRFLVRATDAAGNTDPSPARDKFERKRH
jgi:uncharacterized delta-60 repeat protein